LLGNGNGTFQAQTTFNVGSSPRSVALGDFNGDGKVDLAVSNFNTDNVSVLLGHGTGNFEPAVNYAVGNGPFYAAVGDFNGDGRADLAVANRDDDNVSILVGAVPPQPTTTTLTRSPNPSTF